MLNNVGRSTISGDFILRLVVLVLFSGLFFVTGCSSGYESGEEAIDLYVDAIMLRELNENEKALEKLEAVVEQQEDFSLAYSLMGEIYQQLKDYENSAASYEKAAELNPWSFKDNFNLGRVYQLMEKFTQAVKSYVRACTLKPYHFDAHLNAAKCYYQIEDYDGALRYSKRAEEIDSKVAEVQNLLGSVYDQKKDHSQAIASYKRSLEIDSNDAEIMTSLAIAYLKTNRNGIAKEL
ncbi:MAG: tetratricopeptide repeat protein, partial [Planctomycetota bacterium]